MTVQTRGRVAAPNLYRACLQQIAGCHGRSRVTSVSGKKLLVAPHRPSLRNVIVVSTPLR
jgi:hypothetical protein